MVATTPEVQPAAPGTRGALTLRFETGRAGTVLRVLRQVAPLRVHRAFEHDGDAVVPLVHVGPGLLDGDRAVLDVEVAAGARAVIVPQSATKVHSMPAGGRVQQTIRARVAAGGWLELHGGLVIPFPGATFHQRVEVDLEPGARFLWTERGCTGRVGEQGRFGTLDTSLVVTRNGLPCFADRTRVEGTAADPLAEDRAGPSAGRPSAGHRSGQSAGHRSGQSAGPAVLEGHAAWSNAAAIGFGGLTPDAADGPPERFASCMQLSDDAEGVVLRALHDDPGEGRERVYAFANRVRTNAGRTSLPYLRYGS